jgi:hypothetical protein
MIIGPALANPDLQGYLCDVLLGFFFPRCIGSCFTHPTFAASGTDEFFTRFVSRRCGSYFLYWCTFFPHRVLYLQPDGSGVSCGSGA